MSTRPNGQLLFDVNQFAPFAALSSFFDARTAVNAGFAVDAFAPTLRTVRDVDGATFDRVFEGIDVDVAVRDTDATVLEVAYQVTLLGQVVEVVVEPIPIEAEQRS